MFEAFKGTLVKDVTLSNRNRKSKLIEAGTAVWVQDGFSRGEGAIISVARDGERYSRSGFKLSDVKRLED